MLLCHIRAIALCRCTPIRPGGYDLPAGKERLDAKHPTMTGRWTILQHVEWEGPGLIATEAQARGLRTEVRRLDLDATVPQPEQVDGLVVMGGPMGVYETDRYPYLTEECGLIAELVRRGRPVLGVCLGSQLLAKALGAEVFPGRGQEVEFGSVELTEEGRRDPLLGPAGASVPVFHWHGDTFDLPPGATLLASTEKYAHQAFRFGDCAYGLQFHIEPDPDTWATWREHLPLELLKESYRQEDIERVGRCVIARFFDLALGTISSTQKHVPHTQHLPAVE